MAEKKISWILQARDKMSAVLSRAGSRLKKFASGAVNIMKKYALGFGIGGGAMVAMTKRLIDNADAIGKSAKRLGVSAEFYQKLTFAAERSGASQGAALKGIKKMQQTIFDAGQGLKTYIDCFDALGLTYDDLKGKSPEEQFKIIINALNNVTDATTKSALAQKIFGRSGSELVPMLRDYNSLSKEIEDRGAIISNENIEAAERFKDIMTNIGTTIQAALVNSGFVSWLADIADKMNAVNNLKRAMSEGNKKGIISKDQAVEQIKAQIKKDLANNSAFRKEFEKTAAGFKRGQGIGDAFKIMGRAVLYAGSGFTDKKVLQGHNYRQRAFDQEVQKRLAQMGFTGKEDIISTGISKKQVQAANRKRQEAKDAKTPIFTQDDEKTIKKRTAAAQDYNNLLKKIAEDEYELAEDQQKKFDEITADMEYKLKLQDLLNKKKEKEAAVLEAIHDAEKSIGRELTDQEKAKITSLAEQQSEAEKGKIKKPEIALAGDNATALEKIGAVLGGVRSDDRTYKVQMQIAGLSKESLKVQRQILEKTGEPSLQNV
ncbi:MAG: hypothetical protein M0P69_13350 [Bacteroidales bacterium]|nr:hypothetical protein [Bacteroidales bacterium]